VLSVTIEEARFYSLLDQPNRLTDEQIGELRRLMSQATLAMVRPHILQKAQLRVALDLMESIRGFDTASSDLVATTNRLTRWILALTVLAVILASASVVASGWPYLTWWFANGFRFR